MRRRRGAAAVALAAGAVGAVGAAAACQAPIDPGPALQVMGEATKVRRGDPLPARSPWFDGRAVRLRAARGEVIGVQVLRRADAAPVDEALRVDGAAVRAWRVDDVHVARPSTSVYGPSAGAGDWPDVLVPGAGDGASARVSAGRDALFDVAVAADAAPGPHAGELVVGDARFAVTLDVVDAALPAPGDAPRVWAYYNAGELARGEGVEPGSDRAWAAEQRTWALGRGYGVYATPELRLDDADRRAEAVRGARFVPVLLPSGKGAIVADARAWPAHLAPGQTAFAIPVDEPRTIAAKLAARVIARWLHQAGGGVWLAVTDGPDWLYGGEVDVLCAPGAPGTGPAERRWTYNGAPPGAGAMIADTDGAALRTWGWIAWRRDVPLWYVWDAAYWRDRHNAARHGTTRADAPAFDPARDAVSFDDGEDRGNLDGVLIYPGGRPSLRLAALRRGVEDRALLEVVAACAGRPAADAIAAEVMPVSLAAAAGGVADGPAGGGAPPAGAWPHDEAAWEAARGRLLDALGACAASASARGAAHP